MNGSNTPVIEARELVKTFGKLTAVDHVSFAIQPGEIFGMLGPNGSGKTTTIRCALGLIRPSAGSVRVFGVDATTRFHQVAHRVGAIVESPKMFPSFSGRRNLSLLAELGGLERRAVDRVLEIVGLAGRAEDNFGTYSLGMRQRLAIAGALLKDPDLLILDEPANGLDPAGIAEMRALIRGIADQGKAVVVSSHQLTEVEQICDDVTIVSGGRLVRTGSLADIRSFAGQDHVVVTIDDRDGAIAALAEAGLPAHPRPSHRELSVDVDPERSAEVTRALAYRGRYLSGLRFEQASLERAFLNLTGGSLPPPPGVAPPPDGSLPPPPGGMPAADQPLPAGPGGGGDGR